jgi:hypothetical protein
VLTQLSVTTCVSSHSTAAVFFSQEAAEQKLHEERLAAKEAKAAQLTDTMQALEERKRKAEGAAGAGGESSLLFYSVSVLLP